MKRLLKITLILVLILVPAGLLGMIILDMSDPDAELSDWAEDVLGSPPDRLPPDWDQVAIATGAAKAAGFTSGDHECHVLAWKVEMAGASVVNERCIAWIHHRDGAIEHWALVNLRHDKETWGTQASPPRAGAPAQPSELRIIYGFPPRVAELKGFMDGASWSFAAQQGTQVKDADIARVAGRRLFDVHMNFLLRRYKDLPGEPPPPPPEKRMPPRPGAKKQ